jgi:hypothetical protein
MSPVRWAAFATGALTLPLLAFACGSDHSANLVAGPDATTGDGPMLAEASIGDAATDGATDETDALSRVEGAGAGYDGASPDSAAMSATAGVFTYHNDNSRTGQNLNESVLAPATVDPTHFGKKFSQPIDGFAYAEPLYMPGVPVPTKATHNLVYVVTEHDTVFAFDADTKQPPVWQVSFLSAGVAPVPPADTGETADLVPEIGISGTPVIDPASGTLYVVAKTKEPGPTYVMRLHALDVATGAEKLGGPVVVRATTTGTGADNVGGVVTFDSLHELQRPALLLSGGVVYVAFGDHGDHFNWHGWVLGYDAATLAQRYVYCTTPDANQASIWQSGGGIATDSAGNLYVETGNGDSDAQDGGRDFGMSVLKLSALAALTDWFTPHDYAALSGLDIDLGSAGPVVLPDQSGAHTHLLIASGKPGLFYLLDRDRMGHFRAADDSQIVQTVSVKPNTSGITSGVFATPAYWNDHVYIAAVDDNLKAFSVRAGALSASPVSQSAHVFGYPGATPSVSSNGTNAGIVWVIEGDGYTPSRPAVLHAYDATDLTKELYNSAQAAGGRDTAGAAVKFTVPAVVSGHVYVGTQTELDVYGGLP